MSYGHVLVKKTVCLISGAAGCGKTDVKDLICGRDPFQHPEITALFESIFRSMSVTSMDIEEDKWLDLDESKLSNFFDKAMSRDTIMSATQYINDASKIDSDDRSVLPLPLHNAESSSVTKAIMKHMKPSENSSKEFFHVDQICIIDSGGQSAFHKLFSLFFDNIHVSISVVDLSLRLSERPIDKLTRDAYGDMFGAATKSALTQEEILQHNFRAFQAQLRSIEPTHSIEATAEVKEAILGDEDGDESHLLIVVGTNKDLEHREETIHHKNKRILGLVKEFESHLITCGGLITDEVIFAVNTKGPTQTDKDTLDSVKQKIVSVAKSVPMEKMPIKWYVLELLLRQKSKDILSFEQCLREAEELGMEKDELYAALDYLKQQNSLFFYDCLPNLIFCNPQPLLDKLTELVEKSFELRDAKALNIIDRNFLKGLVTYDLLADDRSKYCVRDGDVTFTPTEFIKFLAYKHVIAQVSDKVFFMPMILPKLEAKISQKLCSEHIAPLAIRFPGGVAPTGVFCSLVASFLSQASPSRKPHSKWNLVQGHCFKNCIKFERTFQDILHITLTLVDSFMHFEAHVDIKGITDYGTITIHELCYAVKDDIQNHLEEVCRHRNLSYELGILCMPEANQGFTSDHVVESHFAVLENTGRKIVYNCEGVSCKERLVTERERCWELPYKGLSKCSMLDAVLAL